MGEVIYIIFSRHNHYLLIQEYNNDLLTGFSRYMFQSWGSILYYRGTEAFWRMSNILFDQWKLFHSLVKTSWLVDCSDHPNL